MKKSLVRVWKITSSPSTDSTDLWISYPEDNNGYTLLSCLSCGHIYSASVLAQVYGNTNFQDKIAEMKCVECGSELEKTIAPYPERFLSKDKRVFSCARSQFLPDDGDSTLIEFDEIYSDF
jgi:rRNA maturation protein Nop10